LISENGIEFVVTDTPGLNDADEMQELEDMISVWQLLAEKPKVKRNSKRK
jgi:hypothetical protein